MKKVKTRWEDRLCQTYHKPFRDHPMLSSQPFSFFEGCFSAVSSHAIVSFGLVRIKHLSCISHTVSEMQLSQPTTQQLHQSYIWESTVLLCHFVDFHILTLASWCSKQRYASIMVEETCGLSDPFMNSLFKIAWHFYTKMLGYTQKQTGKNKFSIFFSFNGSPGKKLWLLRDNQRLNV